MPLVRERVKLVQQMRASSTKKATQKWAEQPTLLTEDRVAGTDILIIPRVTAENRKYIPIGYYDKETICSDAEFQITNASAYLFGILNSAMHMAWTNTVCGRLKSDYRSSNTIVYNNFVFPEPSKNQRERIELAAEQILSIRENYISNGSTLADLYDPIAMPANLMKAHQALDFAVNRAYRGKRFETDNERVAHLFQLYEDKLNSSSI